MNQTQSPLASTSQELTQPASFSLVQPKPPSPKPSRYLPSSSNPAPKYVNTSNKYKRNVYLGARALRILYDGVPLQIYDPEPQRGIKNKKSTKPFFNMGDTLTMPFKLLCENVELSRLSGKNFKKLKESVINIKKFYTCAVSYNDKGKIEQYYLDQKVSGLNVNKKLRRAVNKADKSGDFLDRPIVFIVTNNVPHAILYIIHDKRVYSVGFGYNDRPKMDQTGSVISHASHVVENLCGSLYTPDYLMSSDQQESRIVWVGFLYDEMLDRIQAELNNTEKISYRANHEGIIKYSMIDATTRYCEGAGFVPTNKLTNCLKWASSIIGVKLNCGLIGNPKNCISITEDEYREIIKNFNNPNLVTIIEDMQKRLLSESVALSVANKATFGLASRTKKAMSKAFNSAKSAFSSPFSRKRNSNSNNSNTRRKRQRPWFSGKNNGN